MSELTTLPASTIRAHTIKMWVRDNNPADYLDEWDAAFYQAAKSHNAGGDTIAMQENAKILSQYERKAFSVAAMDASE